MREAETDSEAARENKEECMEGGISNIRIEMSAEEEKRGNGIR